MFCNGYEISGNLAIKGRLYHVYDAARNVVQKTNGVNSAMAWCNSAKTGDVKPFEDVTPEPAVVAEETPVVQDAPPADLLPLDEPVDVTTTLDMGSTPRNAPKFKKKS